MLHSRRAGALTAWGTAYLQGAVSLDEADAATVGRDARHRVVEVPGEDGPVPVSLALGRLRAAGVTALRLVLPESGDATGLPGPTSVTSAGMAAGAVVVSVAGPEVPAYAVLPSSAASAEGDVVRWDLVPVDYAPAPAGLPSLSDADRMLSQAMAESTAELAALDVARGRDDVAGRLRAVELGLREIVLPPTLPGRAQRLVASGARLLGVLDIAATTESASVSAGEVARRAEALRPLRRATRYALCAGYSAAAETSGPGPAR